MVTFTHVSYTIPYEKGERKLLNDAHGFARPGNLTAPMGASDAGETTLLTTLAQRYNIGLVSLSGRWETSTEIFPTSYGFC